MIRTPRLSLLAAALAVATAGLLAALLVTVPARPASAANCNGQTANALLVPNCGAWLGSSDRRTDNLDLSVQENILGDNLDMVRIYKVGTGAKFFTDHERSLVNTGHMLVYSWKVTTQRTDIAPWQQVIRGDHDDALRRVAREIRDSGTTVIFGLHHEPEHDQSFGSDADYAAMYRKAHAVMEPIAGDRLVWFINYMGHSTGGFDRVETMYPGDDIIDWISYNPYNWLGCHANAPWKTFEVQARPFYDWAQRNHPSKPLMIGETATNERPGSANAKAQWIDEMGDALANRMPAIKALLWFHQSPNSGFCERRWDSSSNSIAAFKRLRSNPHFGGGTSGTVAPSPAPTPAPAPAPQPTPEPSPQPNPTAGSNETSTCWTNEGTGGFALGFHPVANASVYVYRIDVAGQQPRYGEAFGYANVPLEPGTTADVYLSAKFANDTYTPAGYCGRVVSEAAACSVQGRTGRIDFSWGAVPGARSYVYEVAVPGRSPRYGNTTGTSASFSLPAGTSARVTVAGQFAGGSYSAATVCGTATAN